MRKKVLKLGCLLTPLLFILVFYPYSFDYLPYIGDEEIESYTEVINPPENSTRKITSLKWITDSMKRKKKVHVLWKEDEECERFDVRLGKHFPLRYLASYPGSGNTWVRYLIEATTGIFTGSIYNDKEIYNLGYLGEKEKPGKGSTIIVKTHRSSWHYPSKVKNTKVPVVLVIRQIEKAILSYWNFKSTHQHLKTPRKASYKTIGFRKHIWEGMFNWKRMNEECLITCENLLVIFYENLVNDPISEVKKIINFLGFQVDSRRLECLRKYVVGPAKRKKSKVSDIFKTYERVKMAKYMKEILEILEMKKIKIPEEYYSFVAKNLS